MSRQNRSEYVAHNALSETRRDYRMPMRYTRKVRKVRKPAAGRLFLSVLVALSVVMGAATFITGLHHSLNNGGF